ncbi:MAG: hypothetical protein IJB82_02995 [Bacilli bacterium]|nr:hypothetical protein [Bacilli bacterium]
MIFDNNLDSTFMMILLGSESTTGKMIMDFVKVIPNNIRTEIIRLTQSGETKKVTIGSYVIDFESEYIGNKLRKRLIISKSFAFNGNDYLVEMELNNDDTIYWRDSKNRVREKLDRCTKLSKLNKPIGTFSVIQNNKILIKDSFLFGKADDEYRSLGLYLSTKEQSKNGIRTRNKKIEGYTSEEIFYDDLFTSQNPRKVFFRKEEFY